MSWYLMSLTAVTLCYCAMQALASDCLSQALEVLTHAILPYQQHFRMSRQDILRRIRRRKERVNARAVDEQGLLDHTSQLMISTLVSFSGHAGDFLHKHKTSQSTTIAAAPKRRHMLRHAAAYHVRLHTVAAHRPKWQSTSSAKGRAAWSTAAVVVVAGPGR